MIIMYDVKCRVLTQCLSQCERQQQRQHRSNQSSWCPSRFYIALVWKIIHIKHSGSSKVLN